MRQDTGMLAPGPQTRPLVPDTRWRRLARALRAILRPRGQAVSRNAGRLAGGAVVAAGVVAQALFGWRWWLVVIVLTVAIQAGIVAATLARPAEREELVDELLAALAPGRQWRRRNRRALARFRAAPFPLYGLPPAWSGPRFLAGWGARRDRRAGGERTTSMQLGHGDPTAARGPLLLVEVDAAAWPRVTHPDLAARLGRPAGPGAGSERVEIPVDGAPVGFDLLADGSRWVAQGEAGDLVVTLEARDLPVAEVRLVSVTDLAPYLAEPTPG
jgi:hypothetical protein